MTNEEREALIAQGWTPPVVVDADFEEAKELAYDWMEGALSFEDLALAGIKQGRALAAEAKPGMVWKVHDGSRMCPVYDESYVWLRTRQGTFVHRAGFATWSAVTHYAIITPPEDK